MGNLKQGRLYEGDAAVSNSQETGHIREELEQGG